MHLVSILLAGMLGVPTDTLTTPWRLADLLASVEAKNPGLEAARAEQLAAEARVGPARRLPDPRLQLGLMNRSLPSLGKRSVLAMDQVQLVQMVPVPGKLGAAVTAARAQVQVRSASIEASRVALGLRAAEDFFELDRVDRSVAVLQRNNLLLVELEAVVRARYSVGSGRQVDVLRAQVELARLQEELTGMQAMRATATARLNALRLRSPDEPIPAVSTPCLLASLPAAATLLEAALGRNPGSLSGRAKLAAAQANRRVASLERWPEFELGIAYGQQPMVAVPGTERMVSLMLGATLPIWPGSRQGALRREADAIAQAAEAELRSTEVETRSRIGELTAAFERAARLRELYRSTILPQAHAAVAAALADYRNGGTSFDAVLQSYLTVSQYELQLIELDTAQLRATAELDALTAFDLLDVNLGGAR